MIVNVEHLVKLLEAAADGDRSVDLGLLCDEAASVIKEQAAAFTKLGEDLGEALTLVRKWKDRYEKLYARTHD